MSHEDFDPAIEDLTARFERAELLIAAALGGVGVGATARELREASRIIEAILATLLAETVAWIERYVPEMYRQGAEEAARSMVLATPGEVARNLLRSDAHLQSLDALARNLLDDMARTTEYVNRDAKRTLREIGRRQLTKAMARTNPAARIPDFRAEMEEQGVKFVDRSGRRWSMSRYAEMSLRTQSAVILNAGAGNAALELGSPGVAISDGGPGDVDEPCRVANGQVWSVAYWLAHLIEHPNCRRSGAPKSPAWRGVLDRVMPGEIREVA